MDKYTFDQFKKTKNKPKLKKYLKLLVTFLLVSLVSYIFLELGFFKDNNVAYYIFIAVFATIIAYFNGYFKQNKPTLNGEFIGKIVFTKNFIEIENKQYPVNNIKAIAIHNNDYVGKKDGELSEFKQNHESFGVNNQLILELDNKQFVEVDFKQNRLDEFEKMKNILISYHKKNLLSFDDLVYILKLEYDIDKNELRKQINKRN